MSAQIFAGHQSLRGSVGSSTAEAACQRPSPRERLASLGLPASTTTQQLCDLLSDLDQECLRHAIRENTTLDADSVVNSSMFLSGSLSQSNHPGTSVFQELQLRALISSLALLQHKEVRSLDADLYDNLRLKNIAARFSKIAFRLQRNSILTEQIRYAPNVYLVQLASQYASFIKRDDAPWPSIFKPLMDITLAIPSVAGGEYGHIRDIIGGIIKLSNIWQRPQTKYRVLFYIQEYTRLATTLCRDLELAIEDGSSELRKVVATVVASIIDQVDEILAAENGRFPSHLAKRWHKALAFISRGPPNLDQGYAYYGLLDCVCQLAALSEPQMLGQGLLGRVKDLIFDSAVPEYRWKAIEIILSCHCTRLEEYRMLEGQISERATMETETIVLEEMRSIKMHLDSDEAEGLRFQVSRPLTRVPGPSTPSIPSESERPSIREIDESRLDRSLIRSCTKYSMSSARKFSKSCYTSAGLFNDCRHVFFYNDREVSVFNLGDFRVEPNPPNFPKVFKRQYKDMELVLSVASASSGFVISTNKTLSVWNVDSDAPIGFSPHGDWDPSGLACHETVTTLVVFSGQRQRDKSNKYNGQIRVCIYKKDGQSERPPVFLQIPANDCPKSISFHADSQTLVCITRLRNKLLVWKLDDEFSSSLEPFEFSKNSYTVESEETGMTSATIYQSPSNQLNVLCTSAPSTERFLHQGEWSFSLLIPSNAFQPQAYVSSMSHDFDQLKDHKPLFVGCCSNKHHIFAVLEASGRLSILRLDNHKDGGIYSRSGDEAEILKHSLCKLDRPLTDCLRFDSSGSMLFAVDPKGKIVVTEFVRG